MDVVALYGLFAYGSFFRKAEAEGGQVGPRLAGVLQFLIAIYGGYFGGGIGFLMLAALTATGLAVRAAGATKNVLAGVMNASAVAIFVFSPQVHWLQAAIACAGAALAHIRIRTPARRRRIKFRSGRAR